jgi:hypothetical protein
MRPKRRRPERGETPVLAMSIDQFCAAHSISPETYFKLKRQGQQPREMLVGRRVLISHESAAAWRRQREATAPDMEARG